jgi:hypothetical protein
VWQAFVSIPAIQVKGKGRDGQPEIDPLPVLFSGTRPVSNLAESTSFFHRVCLGFLEERVVRENATKKAARVLVGR